MSANAARFAQQFFKQAARSSVSSMASQAARGGARSAIAQARTAMPVMGAVPSAMAFNVSRPMMCVAPVINHGFAASAAAPATPSISTGSSGSVTAASGSGDVSDGTGEGTAVSSSALPTGKRKSRRCKPY